LPDATAIILTLQRLCLLHGMGKFYAGFNIDIADTRQRFQMLFNSGFEFGYSFGDSQFQFDADVSAIYGDGFNRFAETKSAPLLGSINVCRRFSRSVFSMLAMPCSIFTNGESEADQRQQ
jgi:hypothetical protein